MSRFVSILSLFVFASWARSAPLPAPPKVPDGYHQVKLNGQTFTLPEGFSIELAAGPDLAPRPISASFDEKGRLYVTDSSGSNEKTVVQAESKPHRILRLEDTDGDGKFDKTTVFVKNVMFPEGAMWRQGSLYVAAPPHIWKFTDNDDDGKADKEEIWFDGKTLGGCANDLHGPYLGPDGMIYWAKGAWAKQEYTLPNGKKWSTRASHLFRAKLDGTNIEPVMTGGMDNPVGIAFTPGGERIFSTTFFQHPGNGKRDGLIHAVHGAIYGKDHEPIYEHPWTSPTLMPPMTHMGPAAPCGLHRYESDQFGKEYDNNLYCCQFNMRKVSRHVLVSKGSTFETKDSDFVVSDNLDFHPTDVVEDADGSLLIVDTGGWYKLCCPTSQLVKPDITGAIYRVKKIGSHKIDDPRGLKVDWKHPLNLVRDARPVVKQRAVDQLTGRIDDNLLMSRLGANSKTSESVADCVVRLLAQIDKEDARAASRCFLSRPEGDALKLAIHTASLWRDRLALGQLIEHLSNDDLHVRRASAEALGRIGDAKAVPEIIKALANETNDRVLDHSLTYALIEIGDVKQTAEGLKHPSLRVRRAVLAALENIPDSNLDARIVFAELDAKDAALSETAWWIAGRHPQWGDQLAGYFHERLKAIEKMTPPEQDQLVARMLPFLKSDPIRKKLGDVLAETLELSATRSILQGMARSGLKTFPEEWKPGVLLALTTGNQDVARAAIGVLRSIPPTGVDAADIIIKVTASRKRVGTPWPKDLDYALRAVAPPGTQLPPADAKEVIADIHRDRNGPVRAAASDLLTRAALDADSFIAFAGALKFANPVEVGKLLPAFAKTLDPKVGLSLAAALADPALRNVIRVEQVKPILEKHSKPVQLEAEKLYALLAEARKGESEKLENMLKNLPPGDIRRGQLVFNNTNRQCATCHKIGYVGGLVGPDLTRIGNIRSERDLLEAIVLPSASFVRSYEPVKVTTLDGRTINGILKKDAPDEIIVVVAADKEERVARVDIDEINPSAISIMPAGLDQQMTLQEIADLVAFLKACK